MRNVVDCLKPKVVLLVGFRDGLNIGLGKVGYVVISGKLWTVGDKQINNDREQWCGNTVNISKNIEDLIVHEIRVQIHRDTEIGTSPELVNYPQKSEELLKQFLGAPPIKLDWQGHKSLETSSNPNMLSMEKRYFIAFKTLIYVVSLGITIVGPHFRIILIALRRLTKNGPSIGRLTV